MSSWARRDVLWALASAATAPLWSGCGAARTAAGPRRVPLAGEDLEQRLRAIAAELSREYAGVSLSFCSEERARAWRTSDSHDLQRDTRMALRIGAGMGRRRRELIVTDISDLGLELAAVDLRRALGAGKARRAAIPRQPTQVHEPIATLLADVDDDRLRTPVQALYTSLAAVPSSQVIRRVVQLDAVERTQLFIADGSWRRARTRHVQTQATLMAWTGSMPATASLARASAGGGADLATTLDDRDLARIHDWALTLLTSREIPVQTTQVVLDPLTAAALVGACVAPCLDGARWSEGGSALAAGRLLGSDLVHLRDDPRTGFGALVFDDDGRAAGPAVLVDGGVVKTALGGPGPARGRRHVGDDGAWTGRATHLILRPGQEKDGPLVAGVDDGILIDGPVAGRVDPDTLSFSLLACRGQQIHGGTLTGRLYGSLEVHGRLDQVLGQVSALGGASQSLPMSVTGPQPMLASAPALTTRAAVRPA